MVTNRIHSVLNPGSVGRSVGRPAGWPCQFLSVAVSVCLFLVSTSREGRQASLGYWQAIIRLDKKTDVSIWGSSPSRAANSGYNPRVCREQRRAKLRNKVENGGVSLVFRSGYLHGDHREGKQREIAMKGERKRDMSRWYYYDVWGGFWFLAIV